MPRSTNGKSRRSTMAEKTMKRGDIRMPIKRWLNREENMDSYKEHNVNPQG